MAAPNQPGPVAVVTGPGLRSNPNVHRAPMWLLESADRSRVGVGGCKQDFEKRKGTKRRSMYFCERTGMIEADSSEALRKACQYELKNESTKERSPTELRCASSPARSSEQQWQAGHGVDCGNQSQQHSAVYPWTAG